jgi:predicted RNA-binding Zn-ribbon protein involved in translation (DUF1610 family)
MSTSFKYKPDKIKYLNNIDTLDGTHRKFASEFEVRRSQVPEKKKRVERFEKQLEKLNNKNKEEFTLEDIQKRSKLKTDIKKLSDEIFDIENNISELDYYSKTMPILMEYYDVLEQTMKNVSNTPIKIVNIDSDVIDKGGKVVGIKGTEDTGNLGNLNDEECQLKKLNLQSQQKRKPKKITKKRVKKQKTQTRKSILNFFINNTDDSTVETTNTERNTETATETNTEAFATDKDDKNNKTKENENEKEKELDEIPNRRETPKIKKFNRASLFDDYLYMIDRSYVSTKKQRYNPIRMCTSCNIEKKLIHSDGMYVCTDCGEFEPVIIESEVPNFKDPVSEKPAYPYKRINHYMEWLSQFQAKESTEIPKEIYEKITCEMKKHRIRSTTTITIRQMKEILKKLRLHQYYEHVPHIISKITGLPPPTISRDTEEKLKIMFKEIQQPFSRHCPSSRTNFLSYSYVLHKFCQLLELDDFIKCFPLLKSREKLRLQDKIWKKICEDLRWQYYPSI